MQLPHFFLPPESALNFLRSKLGNTVFREIHSAMMTTEEILSHIDAEIARLTAARDLFAGMSTPQVSRGPRKTGTAAIKSTAGRAKRVISPEGRARIAAAQKLRWAKQKRVKAKS